MSVFVFANVKWFFSWLSAVMSVLSMRLDSGAIDHRLREQVKMSYLKKNIGKLLNISPFKISY